MTDSNGKELFRCRNAKSFSCVDLTLLNFLLVLRVRPQIHLTLKRVILFISTVSFVLPHCAN